MAEWAATRYGWRPAEVLALTVATLWAYWTAAEVRAGALWAEPSYADRDRLDAEENHDDGQ